MDTSVQSLLFYFTHSPSSLSFFLVKPDMVFNKTCTKYHKKKSNHATLFFLIHENFCLNKPHPVVYGAYFSYSNLLFQIMVMEYCKRY